MRENKGPEKYLSEIFLKACSEKKYQCYVKEDTKIPAMHIDECVEATLKLIETKSDSLTRRVYNLAGYNLR